MARSRRDFDYQPPSYEETVERAERRNSMFDPMFKGDVKFFKASVGSNGVRILPPTWPKARHYGLLVKTHGDVGPNDRQYLCLKENDHSPYNRCPVCEALYELGTKATAEDKKLLLPKDGVIYYIIDREHEKEGVQIWRASSTIDSEIAAQSVSSRNKKVLNIVDPEHGYDVEFTRIGTTRNGTRYRGFKVARDESPLSDSEKQMDQWLDYIFENPLPDVLQFYKPEHIEEVFYGKSKADDEENRSTRRSRARDEDNKEEDTGRKLERRANRDEDEDERPSRLRRRDDDDEDEKPSRRRASRDDDEEDDKPKRSRLAREIDDEIPSDGGRRAKANGRDEEEDERPKKQERARLKDDDEDEKPKRRRAAEDDEDDRPARRRKDKDDEDEEAERPARSRRRNDDEEEEKPRRAARDEDDDDKEQERRRERIRERLGRE